MQYLEFADMRKTVRDSETLLRPFPSDKIQVLR